MNPMNTYVKQTWEKWNRSVILNPHGRQSYIDAYTRGPVTAIVSIAMRLNDVPCGYTAQIKSKDRMGEMVIKELAGFNEEDIKNECVAIVDALYEAKVEEAKKALDHALEDIKSVGLDQQVVVDALNKHQMNSDTSSSVKTRWQEPLWEWQQREFPCNDINRQRLHLALGSIEELGEVTRCVLKADQNIRGGRSHWDQEIAKEIPDVFIYLFNLASTYGIDMEVAIQEKINKVLKRKFASASGDTLRSSKNSEDE